MRMEAMITLSQSGMMNDTMGGGMTMFGPVVPLVVLGLLVLLAVWVVREVGSFDDERAPASEDALQTARQRYARGEIDREEFEQLRSDLRSS